MALTRHRFPVFKPLNKGKRYEKLIYLRRRWILKLGNYFDRLSKKHISILKVFFFKVNFYNHIYHNVPFFSEKLTLKFNLIEIGIVNPLIYDTLYNLYGVS